MIKNKDSLKAKASNLSKKINIPNKYIIQNYMFEALLKRISVSKYKSKFIIKGGLLLASIFGVNLRSTMDMDTAIKVFPLDRASIENVINEIINIMSYNYETIIAEKFETIISRNIDNTRMKDYYDLYMFTNAKWDEIDKEILKKAIQNTSKKRETINLINEADNYINLISENKTLMQLWKSYQENYDYAKEVTFADTINAVKIINDVRK